MIVIADNDVLKKIACCNLIGEFSQAFDVSLEDIFVLNTAKPVLTSKRQRKQLDDEAFERLSGFLDSVSVITLTPDPRHLAALVEQQNIDAGEAVLFSVTNQMDGSVLGTGDKRSLISLAKSTDAVCQELREALTGKVVCFEQMIWRILDFAGIDAVREKLILGRECDKVLALVLGSGLNSSESSIREGLASYITDLRNQTSDLLVA